MAKYQVESDFDDLNDGGDDDELDLSESENPIIKAAFQDEDTWQPPKEDEDGEEEEEEETDEDEDPDGSEDEDDGKKPDSEDEEDPEEEDEDDSSYSAKVQKRIDRERNLRLKAERDSQRRIQKLENREKLRDAKDDLRTAQAEAEEELKKLRKKKRDAKETGETDDEIEIDEKILDIKSGLRQKESDFTRLEKDLTAEPADSDDDSSNLPEPAQKWLAKYPQFNTNKQFNTAVLLADRMVANRGLDKNTDKYYEEIEKILAPQFTEIVKPAKKSSKRDVTREAARKELGKRKKRSSVGGTTKAGTRSRGSSTKKRLTPQDRQKMVNFGLNPNSAEDCAEWARNKVE